MVEVPKVNLGTIVDALQGKPGRHQDNIINFGGDTNATASIIPSRDNVERVDVFYNALPGGHLQRETIIGASDVVIDAEQGVVTFSNAQDRLVLSRNGSGVFRANEKPAGTFR